MRSSNVALLTILTVIPIRAWCADEAASVHVSDMGREVAPATWECTAGHLVAKQKVMLQTGATAYTFLASGCQDPSHQGKHPCAEGNFGMPGPTAANWYWGGFLRIEVNGSEATVCDIRDLRVLEEGPRGSFQIIWSHPDAEVGLRLLMEAGSNHVDADLVWRPREGVTVQSVSLVLTCYPSFFTAAQHRKGERHCATPRTDQAETSSLMLQPSEDTYLYYYDTVFDVARGEGGGPCALVLDPASVRAGRVDIGDYAVQTRLDLAPEAGEARLGLYDFTGLTNAAAGEYLRASATADLTHLTQLDFRPEPARAVDVEGLRTEATGLLEKAGDDGEALKPQVLDLLAKVSTLKAAADGGDWVAEADLCTAFAGSRDLFWKLRTFAVLNSP
jgi:hypothetical protein